MPMLEPQRHALLLKNKKNGNFEEIENVSRIKDRSVIRARPTGIPTPGSKKPVNLPKPKISAQNNRTFENKPQHQSAENISVAERNQKNLSQHKSSLKAPVKSLIRQYQSAPSLIKQAVVGGNGTDAKANSRLPQKSLNGPSKNAKNKAAPDPPPRAAKPTLSPKPSVDAMQSNTGSLRSGHGLGGGSVSQKGFSYVRTDSPKGRYGSEDGVVDLSSNSNTIQALNGLKPKGLTPPASTSPVNDMINSSNSTSLPSPDSGNVQPSIPQPRPKTLATQPRQYAGSPMASQTKFSPVAGQSSPSSRSITSKGLQPRSYSIKQNSPKSVTQQNELLFRTTSTNREQLDNSNLSTYTKSPERKTHAHDSGASTRFCKPKTTPKSHQPKPFAIPVVPVASISQPCTSTSFHEEDIDSSNSVMHESNGIAEDNGLSGPGCHESSENEKNHQNGNKKGLFGLRRLVSNKSSTKSSQNSSKEKVTSDKQPQSAQSPQATRPHDASLLYSSSISATPLKSTSPNPSESRLRIPAHKIPGKLAPKPSPIASRKASIPKTERLHSLLVHKTENDETEHKESAMEEAPPVSLFSSPSSDDDKDPGSEQNSSSSANIPGLTGVLKNSNLVKSTSASSILTDSGASNLSATSSLRTKKVSFQDDVTVCDANGISTFSNGLRHSDLGSGSLYTGCEPQRVYDQSLSLDDNEADLYQGDKNEIKWWKNGNLSKSMVGKGAGNFSDRYRPATPKMNDQNVLMPNYMPAYSYQQGPQNGYSPRVSHQSAVAAAIQSISGNPAAASAAYDKSLMVANRNQLPQDFEQFSVSCASSVPFATRQHHTGQDKEEWYPLQRRSSADASLKHGAESTIASSNHALKDVASAISTPESGKNGKENEVSYFQTQEAPSSHISNSDYDAPPYYECCEPPSSAGLLQSSDSDQIHHADTNSLHSNQHGVAEETPLPKSNNSTNASSDPKTSLKPSGSKMTVMERQLADLTGMVESIITSNDNTASSSPISIHQSQPATGKNAYSSHPGHKDMSQSDMRQQLLKLRESAHELKDQLQALKKQQRFNMEHMNDVVNEKTRDLTQFIASTAGAQHRPLRMRRIQLDQERHSYGMKATRTEKQLSDVEAAVEELRNEVVERRCRVNAREVEALVLQLSQAGRTVAQLKGSFPGLCEELRTVGAAETEVIYAEEKFTEAEPSRLDEQLKRCRQLTTILYTLKKLATLQEARSKTPTSFSQIRPSTPSQRRGAWEDPNIGKRKVLEDVRKIRVDHLRRMESIQDAEVSWRRRRKFILEHDSKKLEKALEMAEKALNRTNYISQVEKRRRDHLVELYNNRATMERTHESNLTTSESSSIESLPPPPPPQGHPEHSYALNLPPHGYQKSVHPSGMLPPEIKLAKSAGGYRSIQPEIGYMAPTNRSHDFGKNPYGNTGSLPRYSSHNRGYGIPVASGKQNPGYPMTGENFYPGRQTPIHLMERSRSVTPQHWRNGPMAIGQFTDDVLDGREMSEEERGRLLEQQQMKNMEKNQRLKEQYTKLQQMQRQQRMALNKSTPESNRRMHPGTYQAMAVAPSAKSSDV